MQLQLAIPCHYLMVPAGGLTTMAVTGILRHVLKLMKLGSMSLQWLPRDALLG